MLRDYKNNTSCGLLIAGDANTHAEEWDALSKEDSIGGDTVDFLDDNTFIVANDGRPTYHAGFFPDINKGGGGTKGETASDVTFFHSDASLSISNWKHIHPIRKCHHDVLSYTIDIRDCVNPLRQRYQRQQ